MSSILLQVCANIWRRFLNNQGLVLSTGSKTSKTLCTASVTLHLAHQDLGQTKKTEIMIQISIQWCSFWIAAKHSKTFKEFLHISSLTLSKFSS